MMTFKDATMVPSDFLLLYQDDGEEVDWPQSFLF